MEQSVIPATIHMDDPDPQCDLNYVPNTHMRHQLLENVMNLSFGFGGANAGLMITKAN
jgi:3-oxoacyl-[acyl-carrier-protein] synthase II